MSARKTEHDLSEYRRKRSFDRTPEPEGISRRAGARYTIQKHAARRLHYDLRLELDGVLKSWAITRGPSLSPREKRLAMRTEDHPLDYAEFEGTIPQGNYGAGTIVLWDRGRWEPIGDPRSSLKQGKLSFLLHGNRLHGRWTLVRMNGRKKTEREAWLLIKADDRYARPNGGVLRRDETSVKPGRHPEAVSTGPSAPRQRSSRTTPTEESSSPTGKGCPAFQPPELATLVDEAPNTAEWVFEVKFDGYRALLAAAGREVHIYTRSGLDWTDRFPNIAKAAASRNFDRVLIDGEIVVADAEGRSDFARLQAALSGDAGTFVFQAFDLLQISGEDLTQADLLARKARLKKLFGRTRVNDPLRYTEHTDGPPDRLLDDLCRKGFEGIIAKRAHAPYRSGRGQDWLKIKCHNEQEFVVGGYCKSSKNLPFASLLLGTYEHGRLRYAGRAGSGLGLRKRTAWLQKFMPLRRSRSPFATAVPASIARSAVWLDPVLVVQVRFASFTESDYVRQGSLLGIREDKSADSVHRESRKSLRQIGTAGNDKEISLNGVRITHPTRPVYGDLALTKRDVAEYFQLAAPHILPHVAHRLLSVLRCPSGAAGPCFFQRHSGRGTDPAIKGKQVTGRDGTDREYFYIENAAGLLALAQMNVLELHPWGSRVDRLDYPDRLVFDLDPDEGLSFSAVRTAAFELRDVIGALDLKTFPLLTGGKGIHVIAPLERREPWPVVKAFARAVAERMAVHDPDRYVATMSKTRRKGRIFIDYLRNERSATAIAPFSPRAREGAPVAWPVTWQDLKKTSAADAMTIEDARRQLASGIDAWADYTSVRQSLRTGSLRALGVDKRKL